MHEHLLEQASVLATADVRRPRQANLQRAISTSYYALFHYLSGESCATVLGRAHDSLHYRRVLSRSFEHAAMKTACQSFAGGTLKEPVMSSLPDGYTINAVTRHIATTFVQLQDLRLAADYDLTRSFSRSESTTAVQSATVAIQRFSATPDSVERRFFLACLWAYSKLIGRK